MNEVMTRRMVGIGLAAFIFLTLHIAEAQQRNVPKIGVLRPVRSYAAFTEALKQGLRRLGYIEGRNIVFEHRFADEQGNRLEELAAELVRSNVDVIVVSSTPATKAVRAATNTMPIVFVAVSDPVASGFVDSLARPGGNLTGLATEATPELSGKRVELLKETFPTISGIVVLNNSINPATVVSAQQTQQAAQNLGLEVHFLEVRNSRDIELAFQTMPKTGANALVILVGPFFFSNRTPIVDLATTSALPAMYPMKEYVEAGGLMSYGPDFSSQFRRAAVYVDKILKGAMPGDLPVERPSTVTDFAINLKTARLMGLRISPEILQRADTIIK
jgi:putative ABC transport system substrate-binding protein